MIQKVCRFFIISCIESSKFFGKRKISLWIKKREYIKADSFASIFQNFIFILISKLKIKFAKFLINKFSASI